MNLVTPWKLRPTPPLAPVPSGLESTAFRAPSCHTHDCSSSFCACPSPNRAFASLARKRDSQPEQVLKPTIVEEVSAGVDEEEDAVIFDINLLVTFRVENLEGALPAKHSPNSAEIDHTADERQSELYVECSLYIDGAPFGLPTRTRCIEG